MKKFYTDDYPRASLGVMSFSLVLAVLIDAFSDPWFAGITDSHKSRFGRRKPFIKVCIVLVPLIFSLGFLPPEGLLDAVGATGSNNRAVAAGIYFGVFHLLTKLMDTLFMIPYCIIRYYSLIFS